MACILFFEWLDSGTVLDTLLKIAGYTYGPLLGLYAFGLLSKNNPQDSMVPLVCVLAPVLTYVLATYSTTLFFGYQMGFEVLLVNAALTMGGLAVLPAESK